MKATLFRQHGGPDVLEYTDFPTPEPKPGEALVRIRAAALNRMDVMVRNGWPGLKLDLPHINGADGAGEIVSFGSPLQMNDGRVGGTPPYRDPSGEKLGVGSRVVINANLGCGHCDYCLSGWDNMCRDWHLLGETIRGT